MKPLAVVHHFINMALGAHLASGALPRKHAVFYFIIAYLLANNPSIGLLAIEQQRRVKWAIRFALPDKFAPFIVLRRGPLFYNAALFVGRKVNRRFALLKQALQRVKESHIFAPFRDMLCVDWANGRSEKQNALGSTFTAEIWLAYFFEIEVKFKRLSVSCLPTTKAHVNGVDLAPIVPQTRPYATTQHSLDLTGVLGAISHTKSIKAFGSIHNNLRQTLCRKPAKESHIFAPFNVNSQTNYIINGVSA